MTIRSRSDEVGVAILKMDQEIAKHEGQLPLYSEYVADLKHRRELLYKDLGHAIEDESIVEG